MKKALTELHRTIANHLRLQLTPIGFKEEKIELGYVWFLREKQGMIQVVSASAEPSPRDAFIKCRLWGRCSSQSFQSYLETLEYPKTLTQPLWAYQERPGGWGHITLDCSRHGERKDYAPWVFLEPTARTSGSTVPSRIFTNTTDLAGDMVSYTGQILNWLDQVQSIHGFLQAIFEETRKYPGITHERELDAFATAWNGKPDDIRDRLESLHKILEERQESNRRTRGRVSQDILQVEFCIKTLEQRLDLFGH